MDNSSIVIDDPRILAVQLRYLYRFAAVLITVENVSVFLLLLVNRKLRTQKHTFMLLFLSLSDTIFGLSLIMMFLMQLRVLHESNGFFCKLTLSLSVISLSTTLSQILIICIDRYVSVQAMSKYQNIFDGKTKYTVTACLWIISTVYFMTAIFSLGSYRDNQRCRPTFVFGENYGIYRKLQAIFLTPLFIAIIVLYLNILVRIKRRWKQVTVNVYPTENNRISMVDPIDFNAFGNNIPITSENRTLKFNTQTAKDQNHFDTECEDITQIEKSEASIINGRRPGPTQNAKYVRRQKDCALSGQELNKYDELKLRKKASNGNGLHTRRVLKSAAVTISAVVVTLLLFVGPFILTTLIENFTTLRITQYANYLILLNSLTNPFLYMWRVREFRKMVSFGRWK